MNAQRVDGGQAAEAQAPIVSVLVLAYNHEPYIREALDSILSQEVDFSFEVLVGEDCSTDGTRAVVETFAAKDPGRVRLFPHEKNLDMHGNHAFLLERARGTYVAYCEGDDYWVGRDKLQRQVDLLRAHPKCGLVHGNYLNLNRIGNVWRIRTAFRSKAQLSGRSGRLYEEMLKSNRMQTCTVLCKTSLLREYRRLLPGVDSYGVGDWPQTLYACRAAEVIFIKEPIAAYRRSLGSVMNSGAANSLRRGLDAIRMVGDFCDYFDDPIDVRMSALAAQYRALLFLAFQAGDRAVFAQAIDWLRQHQPTLLRSMRVRGMRASMAIPFVRRFVVWSLPLIEGIKFRLEFRVQENGS